MTTTRVPASSRPGKRLLLLGLLATAVLGGTCSEDRSYMVVKVRASAGEFTDLTQFKVWVWREPDKEEQLFYPVVKAGPFKISTTEVVDFSVSFATSYTGILKVGVQPLDAASKPVGYGQAERAIHPGKVAEMEISVVRDAPGPSGAMSCKPLEPNTCGPNRACYVGCMGTVASGTCGSNTGIKKVGESCTGNPDCEAGSQCLEFPCGKICMKFCDDAADCPGRDCYADIPCGSNTRTGFRICSQPCDPRLSKQATNGCQPGFGCYIFPREVVSCDCPSKRGQATDGMECNTFADCAAGLVCIGMGGPRPICRPLCKRSESDCAAGRICTEIQDPDTGTTYVTWGACIPPPPP